MQLGIHIRTMGDSSTREIVVAAARAADECAAVSDVWIPDHIAIPPDDAEGSGGRYLDPLATLAYLAAITSRVRIGTSVLVLPYRPALPTAKAVATIQELSGGRVLLGVGVGWMQAEFRAVGVDYRRRGRITDDMLDFFDRCFANEVVEANGQPFLFKPRPARPTIFIGGAPDHAFRRVLRHGAGWMPFAAMPGSLREPIADLRKRAAEAGVPRPEVAVLTSLPTSDAAAARNLVAAYGEAGVDRVIHGARYADFDGFRRGLDAVAAAR
jgi:probable F420-dependent oxidoreductase